MLSTSGGSRRSESLRLDGECQRGARRTGGAGLRGQRRRAAGDEFLDPDELAPELWARLAPDFELHGRPDVPDAEVYRGREARLLFRTLQGVRAEPRSEPREFIDLGHAAVVETRIVTIGRGRDVPIEADETDVFWFRDGENREAPEVPQRRKALAAAGAPSPSGRAMGPTGR
jgi:hypothetical protein